MKDKAYTFSKEGVTQGGISLFIYKTTNRYLKRITNKQRCIPIDHEYNSSLQIKEQPTNMIIRQETSLENFDRGQMKASKTIIKARKEELFRSELDEIKDHNDNKMKNICFHTPKKTCDFLVSSLAKPT